jgi:trk system potassium uptake protein TrkA
MSLSWWVDFLDLMQDGKEGMKNFLVIGLGAFGEAVARTLFEQDQTVVGVDIRRDRVERAQEYTNEAIEADVSDQETMEQVLESIGVENIEAVIVGVGRQLDASVLVCLFLKEMEVKRIIAKVLTQEHARILKRIGVHRSLFPEADTGERLARQLANPVLEDFLHLGEKIDIMEIAAPKDFMGKSLGEMDFRQKYDLFIIAIRRGISMEVDVLPDAETVIEEGDFLVLLGSLENVEKLPS